MSDVLIKLLQRIEESVGKNKHYLQDMLLQTIGYEIAGVNIKFYETQLTIDRDGILNEKFQEVDPIIQSQSPQFQLSLLALTKFDFNKFYLTIFCNNYLLQYLNNKSTDVRLNSCLAIIKHSYNKYANPYVIQENLENVIIQCTTDIDENLRVQVFRELYKHQEYDQILAQKSIISNLALSISDISQEVQQLAIKILSRIGVLNQLEVGNILREKLLKTLQQLKIQTTQQNIINNCILINTLLKSCSPLLSIFYQEIWNVLSQLLQKQYDQNNKNTLIYILIGIEQLFKNYGVNLIQNMEYIIKMVGQILLLPKLSKQLIIQCLKTLINVNDGCQSPLVSYDYFPQLHKILLQLAVYQNDKDIAYYGFQCISSIGCISPKIAQKYDSISNKQNTQAEIKQNKSQSYYDQDKIEKEIEKQHELQQSSDLQEQDQEIIFKMLSTIQNLILQEVDYDTKILLLEIVEQICLYMKEYNINQKCFNLIIQIMLSYLQEIEKCTNEKTLSLLTLTLSRIIETQQYLPYNLQQKLINVIINRYDDYKQQKSIMYKLIQQVIIHAKEIKSEKCYQDFLDKIFDELYNYTQDSQDIISCIQCMHYIMPYMIEKSEIICQNLLQIVLQTKDQQIACYSLDLFSRLVNYVDLQQNQLFFIQSLLKIMQDTSKVVEKQIIQHCDTNQVEKMSGLDKHFQLNPIGFKAFEALHYVMSQNYIQDSIYAKTINLVMVDNFYVSAVLNAIITLKLRGENINKLVFYKYIAMYTKFHTDNAKNPLLSHFKPEMSYNIQLKGEEVNLKDQDQICSQMILDNQNIYQQVQPLFQTKEQQQNTNIQSLCQRQVCSKRMFLIEHVYDEQLWEQQFQEFVTNIMKSCPHKLIRFIPLIEHQSVKLKYQLYKQAYFFLYTDSNIQLELKVTLTSSVKQLLCNSQSSRQIVMLNLDLVEYMYHNGIDMLVGQDIDLFSICEQCSANARALKYKEQDYLQGNEQAIDQLIKIQSKLGLDNSNIGLILRQIKKLDNNFIAIFVDVVQQICQRTITTFHTNNIKQEFTDEQYKKNIQDAIDFINQQREQTYLQIPQNILNRSMCDIYFEGRPVTFEYNALLQKKDPKGILNYAKAQILYVFQQNKYNVTEEQITYLIEQALKLINKKYDNFQVKPFWLQQMKRYNESNKLLETLQNRVINQLEQISENKYKEYFKQLINIYLQRLDCYYNTGQYQLVLDIIKQVEQQIAQYLSKKQDIQIQKYSNIIKKYKLDSSSYILAENLDQQIDENIQAQDNIWYYIIKQIQQKQYQTASKQLQQYLIEDTVLTQNQCIESYERGYQQVLEHNCLIDLNKSIQLLQENNQDKIQQFLKTQFIKLTQLKYTNENLRQNLRIRQLLVSKEQDLQFLVFLINSSIDENNMEYARHLLELSGFVDINSNKFVVTTKRDGQYRICFEHFIQQISQFKEYTPLNIVFGRYIYQSDYELAHAYAFIFVYKLLEQLESEQINSQQQRSKGEIQKILGQWYAEIFQNVDVLTRNISTSDKILYAEQSSNLKFDNLQQQVTKVLEYEEDSQSTQDIELSLTNSQISNSSCISQKEHLILSSNSIEELQSKIVDKYLSLYSKQREQSILQIQINQNLDRIHQFFEDAYNDLDNDNECNKCLLSVSNYIIELLDQNENEIQTESLQQTTQSTTSNNIQQSNTPSQAQLNQIRIKKQQQIEQSFNILFKLIHDYKDEQMSFPYLLRLLQLWYQYGKDQFPKTQDLVENLMIKGLASIQLNQWRPVIIELITHINSKCNKIKYLVQQLIIQIGLNDPQSILTDLITTSQKDDLNEQAEIIAIIDQIRRKHQKEGQDVLDFVFEMNRIATTQQEYVIDHLQTMLTQYDKDKDKSKVIQEYAIILQHISNTPGSVLEKEFDISYKQELLQVFEMLKKSVIVNDYSSLIQAIKQSTVIYQKLLNEVQQIKTYNLDYISDKLANWDSDILLLPGSKTLTLSRIQKNIQVISSKQRPRKITMISNQGTTHSYLLKPKEDIRNDQRIMQYLALLNNILSSQIISQRFTLHLETYPCIPIGKNCGLLHWVVNCDTINDLIKNYRLKINGGPQGQLVEDQALMIKASEYRNLSINQKIILFQEIKKIAPGIDLKQILYLKSSSLEEWYTKRTNYIISTALFSAAGYILGLGDRHPANIMISQIDGNVCHIDYGDTFESCKKRDKLPEMVGFRLTRMLVNAFETSGEQGTFYQVMNIAFQYLRKEKRSLMSIFQTFVDEPLSGSNNYVEQIELVRKKLKGEEFQLFGHLSIEQQIKIIVNQAMSEENILQQYQGWCVMW